MKSSENGPCVDGRHADPPATGPPPFKKGHTGFLVQKDAQCSETYEKQFLYFEKWLILYSNS